MYANNPASKHGSVDSKVKTPKPEIQKHLSKMSMEGNQGATMDVGDEKAPEMVSVAIDNKFLDPTTSIMSKQQF